MSVKKISWVWLWLSIALFIGAVGREVWQFAVYDTRDPVVFERIETLNSPVRVGELLTLRAWREKVRDDCPVVSSPFAISENGTIYELESSFSIGGPAGTPYFDITYPIPPSLPAGQYELNDNLSYRCPDNTFNIPQPTARFVVIGEGND